MKSYYRFLFATTLEIVEFDTEMVSFKIAQRRAMAWAKDVSSTCEFLGTFTH